MTLSISLKRSILIIAGLALYTVTAHGHGEITPFTEEAVERGLIYEMQPFGSGTGLGFGAAIADLNGNGAQDIILLGKLSGLVGLFENDGTGHFTDRSYTLDEDGNQTPKFVLDRPSGIAVADYNGNGKLDVYVTQLQATDAVQPVNLLLRNDGDFNFTDVAKEAGVANTGHSQGAAWGDFDNDGWLDLYVANYFFPEHENDPEHRNRLYHNQGDETFQEVSAEHRVDGQGQTFTPVFTDINRNGWLDLYIANDRGHFPSFPPNQLWRNDAGEFENICETSGDACLGLYAMCVAVGDFNGNGYPDFYSTNIAHPSAYNGWNPLMINQGDETFVEQCTEANVCQVITSWAGIFFDFDNNGWLDLYVCNQNENVPNNLFANDGTFPTVNVAQATGVGGNPYRSFNAAVGDVTGNGALDILLNNYGPWGGNPVNVELFINHEGPKRNWVRFNVVGYDGNVHAIGANIEVTADGHTQWREIYAGGNNYKAQNEPVFHFGLADAEQLDVIVVNWPGGQATRTLSSYPVNTTWTIYPPEMLGDFNGDGVIGVLDLLALLSAWGQVTPGVEMMDMNGDGVIDVFDLLALLSQWGVVR